MTHIKHVNREKALPDRTRSNPVGDVPSDLVDKVLKVITTKDQGSFKEQFALRIGYASAAFMARAHRRATQWAKKQSGKRRMPSHIALRFGEADLLSQALVRRFG